MVATARPTTQTRSPRPSGGGFARQHRGLQNQSLRKARRRRVWSDGLERVPQHHLTRATENRCLRQRSRAGRGTGRTTGFERFQRWTAPDTCSEFRTPPHAPIRTSMPGNPRTERLWQGGQERDFDRSRTVPSSASDGPRCRGAQDRSTDRPLPKVIQPASPDPEGRELRTEHPRLRIQSRDLGSLRWGIRTAYSANLNPTSSVKVLRKAPPARLQPELV